MLLRLLRRFSQNQVLAGGFALIILIGTFFLSLPAASVDGHSVGLLNAFFTATSAVCVTGLVVVDTATHWTLLGKIVIITLIQIGGLGFMSLATLGIMLTGKKISMTERLVIQESLNSGKLSGVVKLSRNIVLLTVFIEFMGAVLLSFVFIPERGFVKGLAFSFFHSISAFCNAGFDMMGNFSSLTAYYNNAMVNFVIMALIILGGLGFTTIFDIRRNRKFKKFALHTKVVLITSATLIILPTILFFLMEMGNPQTLGKLPLGEKVLASLFQVVSPRTAGFNTINLGQLRDSTKFLSVILMFIGGSPASTAGGIKTTSFALIFIAVISLIEGRENIEAFGRRISYRILNKALIILCTGFFLVFTGTMIISFTNPHVPFLSVLYEVVSACGTVGLTLGITTQLNTLAKIVLIFIMFAGRVGSLTVIYAFVKTTNLRKYQYPKEDIMVG